MVRLAHVGRSARRRAEGDGVVKAEIAGLAAALEEGMRTAETLAKRQRDRRLIEAILVGTDDDLDDTDRVPMDDVVHDIFEVIQDLESML